jgi:hypothetical protein
MPKYVAAVEKTGIFGLGESIFKSNTPRENQRNPIQSIPG